MAKKIIEINHVVKDYGTTLAVEDLTLAEKLQKARDDKKAKILATDLEINQRYK